MIGILESGFGRGAKFVAMKVYKDIITSVLGNEPFHGTLNLRLSKDDAEIIDDKFKNGIVYDDILDKTKDPPVKMGGIVMIPLSLKCDNDTIVRAIGIRPLLTNHSSQVLEVIASDNLRQFWSMEDGCALEILNGFN